MKQVVLMIFIALCIISAKAQVTVALGSALGVESGTKVYIPVTVTGIDAANGGIPIIAAEFHVFYDNLNVEYDTTINISSLTPSYEWLPGASATEYGNNWIDDNLLPVSFPDGTVLFEIVFDYKGGTAILDLDSTRCFLVDNNTTNIPVDRVIDGMITPSEGSDQSVWNGEGDWNTSANWSNGVPGLSTIAVVETGNLQIISNANCKSLTVNSGSIMQVMPGFALTVIEGITNNGSFSIESDLSGTGSVISNGLTEGNGTYNTRQYIDFAGSASHLVSSPLPSTPASVFEGLSPEKFTESSGTWQNLAGGDVVQNAGGIMISSSSAPVTLNYTGPFNSADITTGLSYTASTDMEYRGLNLVGNPFPSAISANLDTWEKTGTGNGVYVWDSYRYKFWNGKTGNITDGLIPAMQGFFVRADQTGASIEIPGMARLHSNVPFYKNNTPDLQNQLVLRFQLKSDPEHYDEAFIHIAENSLINYSSESDVVKLMGDASFPQVYSKSADNVALAINTQPDFANSIPLVFEAGSAGAYELIVSGIENIDKAIPLFLENIEDPMAIWDFRVSPTANFILAAGESTGNRYVLHFKTIGINQLPADFFNVFVSNGNIQISSNRLRKIEQLDLFTVSGSLLSSYGGMTLPAEIKPENCAGGILILRIVTDNGVFTRKIVLLN
ncbi:MAG: hypothetical protein IPN08_08690 [Bacteroidales bacterium]|nr:hypothetical protein [Bacteroidales bacterium]